ncbi:DUF4011 domain-containing protein [Pectinatus frisingensis]|uniref:DUF4011 domain-containing protein n=1 Tax=Pectinatus frisingensis TaxID=865 RepID=UPI0018C6CDE6|nr:DUF4011 domain-containing protein [Pectinatus frisingensis]
MEDLQYVIRTRIEKWKTKLLDMGMRNRLLNYRETKRSSLKIDVPEFDALYQKLLNMDNDECFTFRCIKNIQEADLSEQNEDNELFYTPGDIESNRTVKEELKTLRVLRNRAKSTIEEQGINTLYMTFGMLHWGEDIFKDTHLAPLVLVPVHLVIESMTSPFQLFLHDDEIVFNPIIRHKIQNDYGINFPEFDDSNETIESYMQAIEKTISGTKWTVERRVTISLLSFMKINMYNDLNKHIDIIEENPIVRGLCGDKSSNVQLPPNFSNIKHDDIHKPIDIYQVIDADSSQMDAIELMKRGVSFVLQGPPGTGKSQTITNIIAEALANDKKVLFVSEKSAALEVVYNRLEQAGLGDFCLNLHSHKTNKKDVLERLSTSLNLKPIQLLPAARLQLAQLAKERDELNAYDAEVHEVIEPLGVSIYTIQGELAKLNGIKDIVFQLDKIRETTQEKFDEYNLYIQELIRTLTGMGEDYNKNAWKGANVSAVTHELRHDLENNLVKQLPIWQAFTSNVHQYLLKLGIGGGISLENLQVYITVLCYCRQSPLPPIQWMFSSEYNSMLSTAKKWNNTQLRMKDIQKTLDNIYTKDIYALHAEEVSTTLYKCIDEIVSITVDDVTAEKLYSSRDDWMHQGQNVLDQLKEINNLACELSTEIGLDKPSSIFDMDRLYKICGNIQQKYNPCKNWFDPEVVHRCNKIIDFAEQQSKRFYDAKKYLDENYREEIYDLDFATIKEQYNKNYTPVFEQLKSAAEFVGIAIPKTITELDILTKMGELLSHKLYLSTKWIDTIGLETAITSIQKVKSNQDVIKQLKEEIENEYDRKIYDVPVADILTRFRVEYRSFFKIFKSSYRRDKRLIQSLRKIPSGKISDDEVVRILLKVQRYNERIYWFKENYNILREELGTRYQGENTETLYIENALAEVKENLEFLQINQTEKFICKMVTGEYCNEMIAYQQYIRNIDNYAFVKKSLTAYGRMLETVRELYKGNTVTLTNDTVVNMLNKIETFFKTKKWFNMNNEKTKNELGSLYAQYDTNFTQLRENLYEAKKLSDIVGEKVPEKLRMIVVNNIQINSAKEYVRRYESIGALADIKQFFELFAETNSNLSVMFAKLDKWNIKLGEIVNLSKQINDLRDTAASFQELYDELELLSEYQKIVYDLQTSEVDLKQTYGYMFSGLGTNWTDIIEAINWTETFIQLWKNSGNDIITTNFLKKICTLGDGTSDRTVLDFCRTCVDDMETAREQIDPLIDWLDQFFDDGYKIRTMNVFAAYDRLERCHDNLAGLEEWIDFRTARENCKKIGLTEFINTILENNILGKDISNVFLKRFYRLWLDSVIKEHSAVAGFRRTKQDEIVQDFQRLDKDQLKIARERVKEHLIKCLPDLTGPTSAHGDVGILKHELSKKRKIMPLRKLFTKIPELILSLKPCLMMSPLTVSLFLQSDTYKFNLVVFDEASQVCTENALGAIIRGKQLIIAGDRKQLPPSNFFMTSMASADENYDIDEEDDDSASYESILDEMVNFLPERSLKWHYRSRHEELIAFSNAKFYNNGLTTFPSVIKKGKDIGVEYIYVPDGIYDRGKKKDNRIEAQKVVELIFKHIQKHPDRSLGVITFSGAQQSAIDNCLQVVRLAKPEFENFFNEDKDSPFFIKNLENVQGDERDTIIFSIGYAKDQNGVMYMNFGPLSRTGGYRRLNVAITRAKYNVKLVGSIHPTDIDVDKISSDGVIMLRNYIEYAINGPDSLINRSEFNEIVNAESPFEEAVYDFLVEHNYNVETQVGCSGYRIDMAVKNPHISGQFAIGIECDGATYHSARTARDRDRLRQDVLELMGWKIYRIWSTDWIKDTKTEGDKLLHAVETAIRQGQLNLLNEKKELVERANSSSYVKVVETPVDQKLRNQFYPYIVVNAVQIYHKFNYDINKTFTQIIKLESPIHIEEFCHIVMPIYDQERLTAKFRGEIESILNEIKEDKIIKKEQEFILFNDMQEFPARIPQKGDAPRSIVYIHPKEISQIMLKIIESTIGLSVSECIQDTAKLMGYSHCGSNIKTALQKSLDMLINNNFIEKTDGKLREINKV